jgi:hypothetical protein
MPTSAVSAPVPRMWFASARADRGGIRDRNAERRSLEILGVSFDLFSLSHSPACEHGRHGGYDERLIVKNASVADDKATPIYHHFEAPIAATNAKTVASRAVPKTILNSCCGPARLSMKRSALDGLIRRSQRAILSNMGCERLVDSHRL